MATNKTDGICLTTSQQTRDFQNYINTCRNNDDTARANTFFSQSIVNFKDIFQSLRGQYDNFMIAGDAQNSLMSLSGNSADAVKKQLYELTSRKEKLTQDIRNTQSKAEASDREFLDDIMHGQPKGETISTLQDVALGIFWLGWVLMAIVLVAVRWGSPGGNWRAALFTLAIIILSTVCVYALLYTVA